MPMLRNARRRCGVRQCTTPQTGFILVTALIFLLVLAMLSLMSMRNAKVDENIANNQYDDVLAQEAAEMALRDAELDIRGMRFNNAYCAPLPASDCGGNQRPANTRPADASDAATFWKHSNPDTSTTANTRATTATRPPTVHDTNTGVYAGVSATAACGLPLWNAADWDADDPPAKCTGGQVVRTVIYGSFTGSPADTTVFASGRRLPRYLIEQFTPIELGLPDSDKVFFRITAVGFGRTQKDSGFYTSVKLQTVFSPL